MLFLESKIEHKFFHGAWFFLHTKCKFQVQSDFVMYMLLALPHLNCVCGAILNISSHGQATIQTS